MATIAETPQEGNFWAANKSRYERLLELQAAASKHTRGREMNQKKQDPPGLMVKATPGNQETRSLDNFPTNQEGLDSLSEKKSVGLSEADLLIERYGDVMGVVDNHPLFRKATAPANEGGWAVYPQALTRACVEHSVDGDYSTGLAKVLDALRYTANYRAARDKGKFLFAVLRNGKRAK